jgi:acyl-CoA thioester hydrolase
MKYTLPSFVRLSDTDASGRIFYASLFSFTSECFEAYLRAIGLPLENWINGPLPALPVRKVEAEYLAAMPVGSPILIHLCNVTSGSSSLTLDFTVTDLAGTLRYASATITHVAVDHQTGNPTALPDEYKQILGTKA